MDKNMDAMDLLFSVYKDKEDILQYLLPHAISVAELAVKIAKKHKKADVEFVQRAAFLHDIGIFLTHAPKINCFGDEPYIMHGLLGGAILEYYGFHEEARVAMTHVGVGITAEHVKENGLPLPAIDMVPTTLEEKIVAYADLFYCKKPKRLTKPKTLAEVKKTVKRYGDDSYKVFKKWHKKFAL